MKKIVAAAALSAMLITPVAHAEPTSTSPLSSTRVWEILKYGPTTQEEVDDCKSSNSRPISRDSGCPSAPIDGTTYRLFKVLRVVLSLAFSLATVAAAFNFPLPK